MSKNLRAFILPGLLTMLLVGPEVENKVVAGPFGKCGKEVEILDGGKSEGTICIYHFFRCECDLGEWSS